MPDKTAPRPTQVTLASALVMAGSVFVVLTAFDQIAGLRSADTREAVEEFLATPLGDSLGLGLQGTLSLVRMLTMVAAACATATGILGFYILRKSRSARLALTFLAVPLFVAGAVVNDYLPSIVVGSIVMLWFQPARDWVDGKAPRVVTPPPLPPLPPLPAPRRAPEHAPTGSTEPRAYPGFGGTTDDEAWRTVPPSYAGMPAAAPTRPPALVWACALTWTGCAVAFMAMLASVVLVLAAPDQLIDEIYRQNPQLRSEDFTATTVRSTILVLGSVVLVWSAVAAVFAAVAWRGRTWGWTALLVSASCAALLCLLGAITSPALLVPLLFCGVTIPMLTRPEVRAFIRASR